MVVPTHRAVVTVQSTWKPPGFYLARSKKISVWSPIFLLPRRKAKAQGPVCQTQRESYRFDDKEWAGGRAGGRSGGCPTAQASSYQIG